MANIFAGQYKLTNEIYNSPVVMFTEDDSGKIYILKNRYPKNELIKRCTQLSYFDIPREFFEDKRALVDYDYINVSNGDEIIEVLNITVNGPLFRSYTFGTNEAPAEDFIQSMKDRDEEMKHERKGVLEGVLGNSGKDTSAAATGSGNPGLADEEAGIKMEESSETIEKQSEEVCESCQINILEEQEEFCESCQIRLPED